MSEERESLMECSDFYDMADSYLGDELLVETNHEVLQHLEGCAACRGELAARRELRARLRVAIYGDAALIPRTEFAQRLRADLRSKALGGAKARFNFGSIGGWPAAVAASLLIAVGFGLFTLQQRRNLQSPSAEFDATREHVNIEAAGKAAGGAPTPRHQASPGVRAVNYELGEAAAGDHRDCAIKFNLSEDPIELEEAGRKYDGAFIDLASVVKTQSEVLRGQFEFVESHSCVFRGQRFAHVVLKHRGRVVSLLVAGHEPDETAARAGRAAPPDDVRGQIIACSRNGQFQVSCFDTARHSVFIVSDLSEAENLAVARAFAPSVQEHLARSGNAA